MKKYPEYKASGSSWIGDIPENWIVLKLKYIIKIMESGVSVNSTDEPITQENEYGILKTSCVYTGEFNPNKNKKILENEYNRMSCPVKANSIIISRMNTPELVGANGYVDKDYKNLFLPDRLWQTVFFKKAKIVPKWLSYFFASNGFRVLLSSLATGTSPSMKNITQEDVLCSFICLPSVKEQNHLVLFFDYKTKQIDNFISNRQKQIELLNEQKAGIINKAVTKGINPDAKMKDSGIEWIGEVPEHWEIIKLKYIIKTMASGVSVNSTDDPAEPFEFGILKTSCVYSGEFNPNENKKILENEYDRMSCQVKGNSIIMSRMNTPELVGANSFVDKDYKNLFLPDRLWQTVFFKKAQIVPKWLSRFLASQRFRTLISSLATGTSSSMKNITQKDVLGSFICLPPIEEQNEMLVFFENEASTINELISKYQKQINLMQEYRTSLISQAVTGKIDVREWKPKERVKA